jgi:BirA family transcriptional regulator, biotin operon repressor / biotin---[acetyl-CoA-carboxylase] ligase
MRPDEAKGPLIARVFERLCDGAFHTGEELATEFKVTRSAVWKVASQLRQAGTHLEAVRNRGYRLPYAAEPLAAPGIRKRLPSQVRRHIQRLDVVWTTASTNTDLLHRPPAEFGLSEVLLAEFQTAGRGTRGREWFTPPGGSLPLSLSWNFRGLPRDVGALSLAIGVCVLRALRSLGVSSAGLKWPNDILIEGRKLGGILTELRTETGGPGFVVIGIGLNVAVGRELLKTIATTGIQAIDLATAVDERASRNGLAAALIERCIEGVIEFERDGLRGFLREWREADALKDREVCVTSGNKTIRGHARGIDPTGRLLIESPNGNQSFISGEVTVRPDRL